ncbi:MAG: Sapep family Mn(2+)-dependent dipeptidase [Sumerlaeia bacterium]
MSNHFTQTLNAKVDEFAEELIADSQRIIQFVTVSGGSLAEETKLQEELPKCFAWLRNKAKEFGFAYREFEGRVGEISWDHQDDSAPLVIIAGHIDVVTPGSGWLHDPFAGEIHDNEIWGRGTQDDKGPTVQALYAMRALKAAGVELPYSLRLVIGSQEETGNWDDLAMYISQARTPDFGFTPDANFPVINGEKGNIALRLNAEWAEAGKDAETGMEFVSLIGGERRNMVPAHCEIALRFNKEERNDVMKELVRTTTSFVVEHDQANVTLQPDKQKDLGEGRFEAVVSFLGKSAHSSTPEDGGHNAIVDALDFLKDVETMPFAVRRFAALAHLFGQDLSGAAFGVDAVHPVVGETTCCLVLSDVRSTGGRALFNIRPTLGSSLESVLARSQKIVEAYNAEMPELKLSVEKVGEGMEAQFLDPQNPTLEPYLEALRESITAVTGTKGEYNSVGGTTYAKALPNTCAFGPTFPDEANRIHQVDERVPVASVIRNAKIFASALYLMKENLEAQKS